MCTFAGDGEKTTTGAAEAELPLATPGGPGGSTTDAAAGGPVRKLDLSTVRTRNELALLINKQQVKQEIAEDQDEEMVDMEVEGQEVVQ
jgi:hypothetical protein